MDSKVEIVSSPVKGNELAGRGKEDRSLSQCSNSFGPVAWLLRSGKRVLASKTDNPGNSLSKEAFLVKH